ncbi:MAG: DNA-binding protein, partial [Culicoidibacterales bacterium]
MEVQLQKVIRLNQLLDLYGQLLTPKQYDYMDRYYG